MLEQNQKLREGEPLLTPYSNDYFVKTLNINRPNLSRTTTALKEKGCLIKNDDNVYVINPILIPEITGDIVEYSFTFDLKEE